MTTDRDETNRIDRMNKMGKMTDVVSRPFL
jgi:hypothetical protein